MEKIFIFGASQYGKRAYQALKDRYEIIGFLDNDSKKWNQVILDDVLAFAPQVLHTQKEKVVIASAWANEIMEQVQKLTNSECFVFPSLQLRGGGENIIQIRI